MKKILLSLVAAFVGVTSVAADTFSIYSRTTTGTRLNSFSATILRIPVEYAARKSTSTFYVVRNNTKNKEAHIEAFVSGRTKYYYVKQQTSGIFDSTFFEVPPENLKLDLVSELSPDKIQFFLNRTTASTSAAYLEDPKRTHFDRTRLADLISDSASGVVDLTMNNQVALQGAVRNIPLIKSITTISVPPMLAGYGLNCEIHALRDESGNFSDYQTSELMCYNFYEKWVLNMALTEASNSGFGFDLGTQRINPSTDGWGVYQVIKMLQKSGYVSVN